MNGGFYVLGWMTYVPPWTAMTVVDNWRYNPQTNEWSRLADRPVASGNFQTNGPMSAFRDRYIILIGG